MTTTGTEGTVDPTTVLSLTDHDHDLPSDPWIRGVSKREDVSVNWNELNELNVVRASIRPEAGRAVEMVPLVPVPLSPVDNQNVVGRIVVMHLPRRIGDRGTSVENMSTRRRRGITRATTRGGKRKRTTMGWRTLRTTWPPCSGSVDSDRPRSVHYPLDHVMSLPDGIPCQQNQKVSGNVEGAAQIKQQRTWRQYMNRRGGFNRCVSRPERKHASKASDLISLIRLTDLWTRSKSPRSGTECGRLRLPGCRTAELEISFVGVLGRGLEQISPTLMQLGVGYI